MNAEGRRELQLIVSLATSGDLDAASARAAALSDRTIAIEAWRAISQTNANLQRLHAAALCLGNALRLDPISPVLRLEMALIEERRGHHDESLALLESLHREGPASPTLSAHLARALAFAGREKEAESLAEDGLRRWPLDIPLQQQLANLRWCRGEGTNAAAALLRTLESHPREITLRVVGAGLLRNAGDSPRALALIEEGLRLLPGCPAFLTSAGVLLDELGDVQRALALLREAHARAPESAATRRSLVPTLLRVDGGREALQLLAPLLEKSPDDQQLIAWRATALRMCGDAEYGRLHDYPRLVRSYTLQPPGDQGDLRQFNDVFARELLALHRTEIRPIAQSLQGGSQTERNLPADPQRHPAIAAFFAMLDAPIRDYMNRLTASDHPVDRRRRADYRIAGSWSVRLQPGGFHTNHVHSQGWLSSAYYVELPSGRTGREGWLQFGEPGMARPVCAPDHFVEPKPGLLVLFPSYVWHGTVPFHEGGRRLTAAFDVVPF